MVSNAVKQSQEEVIAALKRLRAEHGDDAAYLALRKDLPKGWPI